MQIYQGQVPAGDTRKLEKMTIEDFNCILSWTPPNTKMRSTFNWNPIWHILEGELITCDMGQICYIRTKDPKMPINPLGRFIEV